MTTEQAFLGSASDQFEVLTTMYNQLETMFQDIAKFYAFEPSKYSMEEFFTDIKTFKDGFLVSALFSYESHFWKTGRLHRLICQYILLACIKPQFSRAQLICFPEFAF